MFVDDVTTLNSCQTRHVFNEFILYITRQDYESRLGALQKQVESYFAEAPEEPEAEGSGGCLIEMF